MKRKNIYLMVVMVMGVTLQANAWLEDWSYTTDMPLSRVSPWKVGYWTERAVVRTDPTVGNYMVIDQAVLIAGDGVYQRDQNLGGDAGANYLPDIAGQPIIRLEMEALVGDINDHVYVGLGNFSNPDWGHYGQPAFTFGLMGRNGGEWWLYDTPGTTLYKDETDFPKNTWYDIRMDITPAANGGDGNLDFYYKPESDTTWTQSTTLSGINLLLKSRASTDDPYTEWTGIFARVKRTDATSDSEGRLSTITISGIPEPATLVLLGLGGMMTFLKRRKNV